MAEFAIILPMLLLLTFGTIELGIFLQRQLVITGAGFLAARAATVGGKDGNNPSAAAQEVMRAYSQDSQQPWVGEVVSGSKGSMEVKTEANERQIRVNVTKKEQSLSDLLRAFGGGGSQGGQLGTSIVINREFVQGRGNKSAAQYPANAIVNYPLEMPWAGAFLAGLQQFANTIQSFPLPPQAKGFVSALTFTPLQAVSENPGRDERYQVGRTEAAVYASSDLERLEGTAAYLQPSKRIVDSLETAPKLLSALQLAAKTAQDPSLQIFFKAIKGGAAMAAKTADTTLVTPLRAVEMSLFTTTGDIK